MKKVSFCIDDITNDELDKGHSTSRQNLVNNEQTMP